MPTTFATEYAKNPLCRGLLIALLVLSATGSHAQTLYKVVNKDGTVTYTDQPLANAEPVVLGADNRITSTPAPNTKRPSKQAKTTQAQALQPKITIITPAEEATIRDNIGNVTIKASVVNAHKQGRYQLFVNSELISEQSSPVFFLEALDRGAYQFFIKHISNKGKTLASTSPRTFYLHKASRLIN